MYRCSVQPQNLASRHIETVMVDLEVCEGGVEGKFDLRLERCVLKRHGADRTCRPSLKGL